MPSVQRCHACVTHYSVCVAVTRMECSTGAAALFFGLSSDIKLRTESPIGPDPIELDTQRECAARLRLPQPAAGEARAAAPVGLWLRLRFWSATRLRRWNRNCAAK